MKVLSCKVVDIGAFLVLAAGCSSVDGPSVRAPLGREFQLGVAQSATVTDEMLVVSFDGVASDSRCPMGVLCIQAGDALVQITVERPPVVRAPLTLHTDAARGDSASFEGYSIRLVALSPIRRADETIAPGQYVATLVVSRP